jgi:hypothetical protein
MTPREELADFYNSLKVRAPANFAEYSDLLGPDLIWLDDEYLNASPRIVIIGQEQKGWDYSYPEFVSEWSVTEAIAVYREFDFGVNYHASPFWQFFHAVRQSTFPNEGHARRKVLWTNLVKFVSADSTSVLWKPYREAALQLQQDVLTTELEIAKPDICLFVTGPNYDPVLERYFDGVQFEQLEPDLPVRQYARLKHPNLPGHSYRIYHPNYLNRDRNRRWNRVFHILSRELSWPDPVFRGNILSD